MSNFDFDKYKNSFDKVTVSDEKKEELIALMKKENNATKPQSQNKVITFKRAIVLAASVVIVILLAIATLVGTKILPEFALLIALKLFGWLLLL